VSELRSASLIALVDASDKTKEQVFRAMINRAQDGNPELRRAFNCFQKAAEEGGECLVVANNHNAS